jgi:hypothetical protein
MLMNDSVFGELTNDGNGFSLERQFSFLNDFLPASNQSEDTDDQAFRSGVIDELGPDASELLDKPLEDIDTDELPESVKNSSLGFLLKHGERIHSAMENMLDDDIDEEQEAAEKEQANRAAQGILPVSVETLGRSEPSDAQREAYKYIEQNEQAVSQAVTAGILEYYQFIRKEDPNWFDDWDCPEIDSVSDLAALIEFAGLVVTPFEINGDALVGFQFHCDWDLEQGLGVLIHNDRVIEIGDGETSFEPHESSVWQRIKPELREEVAALVVATKEAKDAAFNELSPTERLTHALVESNDEEIQKLIAEGADINGADYPALFVAIDEPNAEMAQKVLEIGGKANVRFEGQSALEYANEILDSVNQSKKFFVNLGDDLIEELAGPSTSFFDDAELYSDQLEAIVALLKTAQ